MDETPVISLERIRFAYPERPPLFEDLSLSLRRGGRIGLYGPNGSGKTTLLRLMVGLETPLGGAVLLHGEPARDEAMFRKLRRAVGFVMQNSDDQLFSATVLDDVAFGPLNLGLKRGEARDRAAETLEELDLAGLAGRATHRLSAGEKKMAALASVLSMRPEALLLDEPTSFLDDESRSRIIGILQKQNLARIVVSHDRDFLGQTASSFVRIADGRAVGSEAARLTE